MRKRNRKLHINNKLVVVLAILLAVGFAYISSAVNIGGMFTLSPSTYDVHFENVQVIEGSVDADTLEFDSDDTEVSVSVKFTSPGDFYEFTIDAVNAGDIDAMINTVSDTQLTEEQEKYIDYSVTYEDGEIPIKYHQLNSGDSCTFKVKASFKENIDTEDLPVDGDTIDLTLDTNYVKADSNRIKRRAENTLYNVLKEEAESGGLAKKYTGEHQDSMDESLSTKDIYHWYEANMLQTSEVLNKNNVIFANHCWQMLRTTDTGGTKLIYNGEVENNQCLNTRGPHVGYNGNSTKNLNNNYFYGTDYEYDKANNMFNISGAKEQEIWSDATYEDLLGKYTCMKTTQNESCTEIYLVESYKSNTIANVIPIKSNSHYSQFGTTQYNSNANSPAYLGYMYNKVYQSQSRTLSYEENVITFATLSTEFWYADSITAGGTNGNQYFLNNPYKISDSNEYTNLTGKYTFRNNEQNSTENYVYYIVGVDGSTMYYIILFNGNNLNYYNDIYTYGDSYTDNGDGTYTINNASTIERKKWFNDYLNVEKKYVCKNATNNKCNNLMYSFNDNHYLMRYYKVMELTMFSNNFSYDGNKYILNNNNSMSTWNSSYNTIKTSLNNNHYTCWNNTGECETISYIYNLANLSTGDSLYYYINLVSGKNIENAKDEMLYDSDVNKINSTIKTGIDKWYEKYLFDYSNYIEDTVFCNDRSQRNANTNGWYPNGGNLTTYMQFKEYNSTTDINCINETDRFSTLNSKAKLKYKVGLVSSPEMQILNNTIIRKTGEWYWLISPYNYSSQYSYEKSADLSGYNNYNHTIYKYGVRPAISLSPKAFYTSGNGSMETPYEIYTE